MSEPDHVAVMKRAKELCAQDGLVWWELAYKAEPNPLQRLVSDNRRQVYMARARDQLRRERLAAAETLHNSTESVPATPAAPRGGHRTQELQSPTAGLARHAGVGALLQTHISDRFSHGEAPPPLSTPPDRPRPRIERTLTVFISAARSTGWMAPLGGLALIGLAAWATLYLLPASRSLPVDTPAVALQPSSLPHFAPPISPGLPPGITEEALLKQVEAPWTPITQAMAEPAEHKTVGWRKLEHRSRFIARRASFARRRTPVSADRCPYQCSWEEAMRGGDH